MEMSSSMATQWMKPFNWHGNGPARGQVHNDRIVHHFHSLPNSSSCNETKRPISRSLFRETKVLRLHWESIRYLLSSLHCMVSLRTRRRSRTIFGCNILLAWKGNTNRVPLRNGDLGICEFQSRRPDFLHSDLRSLFAIHG